MIILGTLGILGMIAPQAVVHLFRDDPRVVEIGALALRFQCVAVSFQSFSVTANMMFQSVGRSREASFLATLRSGLFYIPLLIILPRFMGLMGIQSAQIWSDILTTAVCLPFVIRFFREIPKEDQETAIHIAYRRTTGK
jgi:Na+-driven multidrug efflux pump